MEWPVLKAYCYGKDESKHAKRLRRQGYVPFSVYHKNSKPIFFKAKANELERFFIHNPGKMHLELEIDDNTKKRVVFKEIQRDPVMDNVIHMDLYEMVGETPFKVKIPIKFIGTAIGTTTGGSFERQVNYLNVIATPQSMCEALEVDVTNLEVGDCMFLEILKIPEGIKFLDPPRTLMCNVVTTRAAKEEDEEEEGEEGAEGAEAPAEPAKPAK